ncbi:MAG: sulfur reduction protein DsrE [Aquificae bacterium]|nr:sulfur reduction protein DsrE [Aquificota bacterium]
MRFVHLLKGDPFSWKAHEALRIATATAINAETYFVCIRDGVYVLTHWKPEALGIEDFDRFWEAVELLDRFKVVAEEESLHERGLIKTHLKVKRVEILPSERIKELIRSADFVAVW